MTAPVVAHPIPFTGAMVRAILDGRKTQTRRVVKPQPPKTAGDIEPHPEFQGEYFWWFDGTERGSSFCCPYGVPGDRLWVKETWQAIHVYTDPETGYGDDIAYAEEIPKEESKYWAAVYAATDPDAGLHKDDRGFPWRPSIHMPRWASRITLEVTGVRCERLQEITAAGILAEGAVTRPHVVEGLSGKCPVSAFDGAVYPDLRSLWVAGWNSIYAKRGFGWATNPWVWVVEFRRSESGET